jgi:hypothetical protein
VVDTVHGVVARIISMRNGAAGRGEAVVVAAAIIVWEGVLKVDWRAPESSAQESRKRQP